MDQENKPQLHYSQTIEGHMEILKLTSSVPVNQDVRAYFNQTVPDGAEPWLSKPEVPSPEEVMANNTDEDDVMLVPNKIIGPWESKEAYLKAHYELLREDSVAPLRDAVAYFREDPRMMDSPVVAIYEKVHIIGITLAKRGLAARVQFSAGRSGKKIIWEYSKRLITGSIVALSPAKDSFRNECIIAVVAARPLEGVKQEPPQIDIFFARPQDTVFDPQAEWVMVEAKTGYYESARHTMTALQKLSQSKFPLAEHICFLDPDIDTPEHIKNERTVNDRLATETTGDGTIGGEQKDQILDWFPALPIEDLDLTQRKALEQILTKSLAIIHGPPGTGKTYISVVALKLLLSNMNPGDPPIILSSQTNHALDQLLRHISSFEKDFIRLGGRSGDPEIKKRTLFNVKKSKPETTIRGSVLGSASMTHKNLSRLIREHLQDFNLGSLDNPFPASFFLRHGLLTQEQCDKLAKGAKGWVRAEDDEDTDPLITWLGEKAARFKVNYTAENFGFAEDEIDLEYEQLKELEAEQGLEDDDYETLRGDYIPLREGVYGQDTSSISNTTLLEFMKNPDLWSIPAKARGSVYNVMRNLAKRKILYELRRMASLYHANCRKLQIGKWEWDNNTLRHAKIIGMTATGLSKYRGLVSSLNPRVVLIEEAAEVIEAPIVSACFDSLQHLILVGDHQQLKGHCSVDELAKEPFFLDTSMFERLVTNGIDYVTLRQQRRMAPEIRRLLHPIYGTLEDHQSAQLRPKVPGMGDCRSFLFSHNWPEYSDSFSSKYNEKEAEMIVGFFVYLVFNGVQVNRITVLTFYNGQRKKLLRLLRSHSYLQGEYVNVVTVDSYQGEENDIVILSLVRSGTKIGFLSVENRVCVALSRARCGFYIFGNAKKLSAASPLWEQVISILRNESPEGRLGDHLPLRCIKHGNPVLIRDPSQWTKNNGGCELPCDETLDCKHKCTLLCHSFPHHMVSCMETCNRQMQCGHRCEEPCARVHDCACDCPQSSAIVPIQDYASPEDSFGWSAHALQRAAVDGNRAFANGGAKEHDALPSRMATHPLPSSFSSRSQVLAGGCDVLEDSRNLASRGRHGWIPDGNSADMEAPRVQPNLLDDH